MKRERFWKKKRKQGRRAEKENLKERRANERKNSFLKKVSTHNLGFTSEWRDNVFVKENRDTLPAIVWD